MRRFVRMRWAAGAIIIGGAMVNGVASGWSTLHFRVLVVGGLILLYNVALWRMTRPEPERPSTGERQFMLSGAQLVLDLLALTLLLVWTGGVLSPLIGLYVLHMVIASLLLPPLASYLSAALAIAMVVVGLLLADQWPQGRQENLIGLGWMVALLLTIYLTNHITRTLRQSELELENRSRRIQSIVETAADGIITTDEEGTIRSFNPAAEKIFGYAESEVLGQNIRLLMPEPYRSEHSQYMEDYLRTGLSKIIDVGREVAGLRKDGTTFPLDAAVSEVRLDDRLLFTGIVRDVTERKQAEEALRRLNEELKRQQQAMVQHEKMAAMGQMAAGVAHEIANPLASMDSLLQLIKRQPTRMQPETIDVLRQQVDRISRIVQQMTDFAHPNETGWEMIKLNDLIEDALQIVRFDHRIREVEITKLFGPEIGSVRVIPHALQQVMVNLVLNALDAMAEKPKPKLTISTETKDEWRLIRLQDNGHGIPAGDLKRIFEPFFTTKPIGQGTGLGLSIIYNILERHGGRIEVETAVGEGTTFTVFLPDQETSSGRREGVISVVPESENTDA